MMSARVKASGRAEGLDSHGPMARPHKRLTAGAQCAVAAPEKSFHSALRSVDHPDVRVQGREGGVGDGASAA